MFGTSAQGSPYFGYQAQMPLQQAQMSPMLQQLMSNPAFLARLRQLQGTGLGGMTPQPYGFGIQPNTLGAQSLR